jgi:hypothetical protein
LLAVEAKTMEKVIEILMAELKQQHGWRLEDSECGGDEVKESYERLKSELVEKLIYSGLCDFKLIKQIQDS